MTALGRHQRESFLQVKTHLVAEDRDGAGTGAVIFLRALGEHFLHQIKILFHGSSRSLLLRTTTVRPDHHNDTRKHHWDRKNLPHADVLYPFAGELLVWLAEELHDNAEQAVANQEQTRDRPGRARFTDKQIHNQEQDDPFQRQFV